VNRDVEPMHRQEMCRGDLVEALLGVDIEKESR
jgi:hypothetical protein